MGGFSYSSGSPFAAISPAIAAVSAAISSLASFLGGSFISAAAVLPLPLSVTAELTPAIASASSMLTGFTFSVCRVPTGGILLPKTLVFSLVNSSSGLSKSSSRGMSIALFLHLGAGAGLGSSSLGISAGAGFFCLGFLTGGASSSSSSSSSYSGRSLFLNHATTPEGFRLNAPSIHSRSSRNSSIPAATEVMALESP